jgi:pyruvate formate lyase activating enzyme
MDLSQYSSVNDPQRFRNDRRSAVPEEEMAALRRAGRQMYFRPSATRELPSYLNSTAVHERREISGAAGSVPFGRVHAIKTFRETGGETQLAVFIQGCHMRCCYCHDVSSWSAESPDTKWMTADRVLEIALRSRDFRKRPSREEGAGGIVVAGGEPLLQIDFLVDLMRKAGQKHIYTCLHTTGEPFQSEGPWFERFQELMTCTDLVVADIKHIDPEIHREMTGRSNESVLEMFRYLDRIHKPVIIRYVLVPGLTDDVPVADKSGRIDRDYYLKKTKAFVDTLSNVRRLDVYPYHTEGTDQWEKLGIQFPLKGVEPPSEERLENARRILTICRKK